MVAVDAKIVDDEIRFVAISKLDEKFYTVVYTCRKSIVRLISTRRSRKMRRNFMKSITAKEFDDMFDNGEDISEFLDLENIKSFKEFHE